MQGGKEYILHVVSFLFAAECTLSTVFAFYNEEGYKIQLTNNKYYFVSRLGSTGVRRRSLLTRRLGAEWTSSSGRTCSTATTVW